MGEEHRITGDVLLELTSSDLEEIAVHAFGDRKRLLRAVDQLRRRVPETPCTSLTASQTPCSPPPSWSALSLETASPWGAVQMPPLVPPPTFDVSETMAPPPSF